MTEPYLLRHTATDAEAGGRLDRVLAQAHPGLSRSRIQALIAEGRLSAGGRTITEAGYRVKPAERFALALPPPRPARPRAQAIPLDVVHEDEHLLVVDKPAGLVVHPAAGHPDGTLVNALIARCGAGLSGVGGEKRPGIVHRLDKDTSGLMVVAKTDDVHIRLSNALAARRVSRVYRALVRGAPVPPAGEIEGAIGRAPRNRKKMAVLARGGKPALTRYAVERTWGGAVSLVRCSLATGRTHQIRVHMNHIGHAVLGDRLYGAGGRRARPDRPPEPAASALTRMDRQALHAARLGFHHPATNELLEFDSALPEDIAGLVEALDDAYSVA